MNFESENLKGKCKASAEGELTIYCANDFKEKITQCVSEANSIELDLSKVEEIDTSCLQLLMQAKQACLAEDKRFELSAISPAINDVLHLLGMERFFGEQLNVANQ